jgi:hypothetical protein
MKKLFLLFVLIYSIPAFSLEIAEVKNAQLKDLYFYNGSRVKVYPEEGVLILVKGIATKKVKIDIKVNGIVYLVQGVKIANIRAKHPIITLDKYGEGEFVIGFSLLGEKNVSGPYKKPIKYKIDYVD